MYYFFVTWVFVHKILHEFFNVPTMFFQTLIYFPFKPECTNYIIYIIVAPSRVFTYLKRFGIYHAC